MVSEFLQDAIFAAIAAVGFSAVSNPPRRAYLVCALIAAAGHSLRYFLMQAGGWHIVGATFLASLFIGIVAVLVSPRTRIPAETYLYPSLLPMIPGIYAYKTFAAMAMCVAGSGENDFSHYFYLFADNGMICFAILSAMVLGATLPMFLLSGISFKATRPSE